MWLGFFIECMVSLIFLGINLLSLSITLFLSQLKLWFASQQCFEVLFLSQSSFLTDLFCSSERDFKDRLDRFTVTTVNFINDIVFIFCSYLIFRFTKEFILFYEIWVYTVVFHQNLQHTVNLYSFWCLPIECLWPPLVVATEANYDC